MLILSSEKRNAFSLAFRACPHCGDGMLRYDPREEEISCLACGYVRYIEPVADLRPSSLNVRARYNGDAPFLEEVVLTVRLSRVPRRTALAMAVACPFCGEMMTVDRAVPSGLGPHRDARFRCPSNHAIWINPDGTRWR